MPTVNENDDERVVAFDLFTHEIERSCRLRWLPQPTFIIGLDEVQRVVLGRRLCLFARAVLTMTIAAATRRDDDDEQRTQYCAEAQRHGDTHDGPSLFVLLARESMSGAVLLLAGIDADR